MDGTGVGAVGGAGAPAEPADNGILGAAAATGMRLDEEDVELMRGFGDHALMDRVQRALQKQLESELLRMDEELRVQEEERDASRKRREEVGVELYGVQQQLAKLQLSLETTVKSVAVLHDIRSKAEAELKVFQDGYASRKAAIESEEAKLDKFKGEMDGIADTLRQVEKYNEEMAAEIALTKRAASKAELDIGEAEKAKVAQDLYIDSLTSQIKRAAEQVASYEAQIAAQKAESASAAATMAEAAAEMETIAAEKKQLLSQWNASLTAMRRRDELLASLRAGIAAQTEALSSMDAEEANLAKEVRAVTETHASLAAKLAREEANLKALEASSAALRRQYEALEQRQESLAGTMETTEGEIARVGIEIGRLEKQLREADRERLLVDKQRFGIEDEIAEALSKKTTSEKAARALLREARALIASVHDVELQCADMENSIAAAKVDALNANGAVSALRDTLAGASAELREKESLIERYEGEIKARHDAIEKKMAAVDRLNRKYEKMVGERPEAENMGPLQAELHNLSKSIAAKREACEGLQKRWLQDQTALVAVANDAEVKQTRLRELGSHVLLLDQKRLRLESSTESQRTDLRRLRAAISTMHEDMGRINALIAKNAALSSKLAAATATAAAAFSEELREMQREAAAAEARVASIREEKGRLLEELLECERQVLLWEKKIALEKEMQEAIDPRVGQAEIAGMEKEIHRMRLRQETLKREQERLVGEMERAIAKREAIAMKNASAAALTMASAASVGKGLLSGTSRRGGSAGGTAAGGAGLGSTGGGGKGSAGDAGTRLGLKQRAAALRADIEEKMKVVATVENALEARQADARALAAAVEHRGSEVAALEAATAAAQRAINAALYEKQKGVEAAAALTRLLQRLEALESGKLPRLTGDEASRARERLAQAEASREAVRRLVGGLAQRHVELAEVLDRVSQLVDIAPPLDPA